MTEIISTIENQCYLQGGDFEKDSIYQCPYKIDGNIVTVYNGLRIKLLNTRDKRDLNEALNMWDMVTLCPGDSLEVGTHRSVHHRKIDSTIKYSYLYLNYPPVRWNGKAFIFYSGGPTSVQNLRDLRPICAYCGILIAEGDHTECLLYRDDYV